MNRNNTKNQKLFIVDDELFVRQVYEHGFRMMGYDVDTAIDGHHAIWKLDKMDHLPTLILLDIEMPRSLGFDVLRYIQHNDRYKNVKVVMLTNISDEEVRDKTRKLGAIGYIVKGDQEPREVVQDIHKFLS